LVICLRFGLLTLISIRYKFSQHLNAPAEEAFKWCTDYEPGDIALMGEKGTRKIEWIAKDAVILTESSSSQGKRITKKKLVRLNPAGLSWTNTHIAGPMKYSQFLYQLVPEGRSASRLEFTGLQVEQSDGKKNARELASKYRKEDSTAWKNLAGALDRDFSQKKKA
jgi:hypothetical protein